MDCQYPHQKLIEVKTGKKREGKNYEEINRKSLKGTSSLPVPYGLPCPQLSLDKDGKLVLKGGENPFPSLKLGREHNTYPVPLFKPFVARCGQGHHPENVLDPLNRSRKMLKDNLQLEVHLLMKNRKSLSMAEIAADWKDNSKDTFHKNFPSMSYPIIKYGNDFEMATEQAKFGGNLCCIRLNNADNYLIHSSLGDDGNPRSTSPVSLYLSRVSATDSMKGHLLNVGQEVRVDGGRIYQITTPHNSYYRRYIEHDIVFGTRQKHSSRLWKVASEENEPVIQLLYENTDESSTVRSIDVHPSASFNGEYCELRRGKLTSVKEGKLDYQWDVDENVRYCLYQRDQPSQFLLASYTNVSVLDPRSPSPLPVMSLKNQMLQTHWNVPSGEHILSFTPSSRPHVTYVTTETCVMLWDRRNGSRLLSKLAPYLEHSPKLLTSVNLSPDEEWVFIASQTPHSSSMCAFKWSEEPWLARSPTNSLSTASPLMLPAIRKTLGDTIDHLQQTEPWAFDRPLQNRFQQHVTGLTSYFDEDKGIIQIWNSTAAGDIFVQHLSKNVNLEESQITTGDFSSRVKEWSEKLMEQPAEPESMYVLYENLQRSHLPQELGENLQGRTKNSKSTSDADVDNSSQQKRGKKSAMTSSVSKKDMGKSAQSRKKKSKSTSSVIDMDKSSQQKRGKKSKPTLDGDNKDMGKTSQQRRGEKNKWTTT